MLCRAHSPGLFSLTVVERVGLAGVYRRPLFLRQIYLYRKKLFMAGSSSRSNYKEASLHQTRSYSSPRAAEEANLVVYSLRLPLYAASQLYL